MSAAGPSRCIQVVLHASRNFDLVELAQIWENCPLLAAQGQLDLTAFNEYTG
jgi:hypothetical protein